MAELARDYLDTAKQDLNEEIVDIFPASLRNYNLDILMPTVRGQVILEIPCGIGSLGRTYYKKGAAKVIASDISSPQIEVARKCYKESEIPYGFVEYYSHDCTIPKRLSETLADLCSSFHIFCFAKNTSQLHGTAQMLNINLKPGALCVIIVCSVGSDETKYRKAIELCSEERLIHLDPMPADEHQPRKIHTHFKGFNIERYVWPRSVVCEVLRQEGFSRTEIVPYKVDPSSRNPEDIKFYIEACNLETILAWKDNSVQ